MANHNAEFGAIEANWNDNGAKHEAIRMVAFSVGLRQQYFWRERERESEKEDCPCGQ